jgi:anti-anti-sigma factor
MRTESGKVANAARRQAAVLRLAETEYGSHDHAKLARVRRLVLDLAENLDPLFLVVDLSAVHYFGARFINILVSTWNQLRKRNRRLVLCGPTPFCAGLIKNLQLHRLLDIFPTQRIALDEIERGRVMVNNFAPDCRFGHAPFDLLMEEVHA